jgi:hypothetical protein
MVTPIDAIISGGPITILLIHLVRANDWFYYPILQLTGLFRLINRLIYWVRCLQRLIFRCIALSQFGFFYRLRGNNWFGFLYLFGFFLLQPVRRVVAIVNAYIAFTLHNE